MRYAMEVGTLMVCQFVTPVAGQAMSSSAPQATLAQPANGASRILVVDDNRDAAHTLARLLTALGTEAREAHSGADAIAAIECHRPDLVFLDLGMAEMDGFETARQIKAQFPQSPIPIVAITGLGQQEDRERTSEAGFAAHLVKPVTLELLEATLCRFFPACRATPK